MPLRPKLSATLRGILEHTQREVAEDLDRESLKRLKDIARHAPKVRSFHDALAGGGALIAEVKERSPSQGPMRAENVGEAARAYQRSRVVKAVSVLTNRTHFGMDIRRLSDVRARVTKPVLRKDFIVEPYQVWQARAYGADAVLLMANVLDAEGLRSLSSLASDLGMDVLFETHTPAELADLPATAKIVGINCRNFEGGIGRSFRLARVFRQWIASGSDHSVDLTRFNYAHDLPSNVVKVAESGVTVSNVGGVFALGFQAVLVGTSLLMDPRGVTAALEDFEKAMKSAPPRRLEPVPA